MLYSVQFGYPSFGNSKSTHVLFQTDCLVKEIRSETLKPCQFPFKWNGETYDGCTNRTEKHENGGYSYGNPWCSTKKDPITNEHVQNGTNGFYGDCISEFCPSLGKYLPECSAMV